jgi:glutaredoxin
MKVIVYSKDECIYCDQARELLKSQGREFIEQKLGKDFTREALKGIFPNAKTFPVVTINGVYIGGFSELNELLGDNIEDRARK